MAEVQARSTTEEAGQPDSRGSLEGITGLDVLLASVITVVSFFFLSAMLGGVMGFMRLVPDASDPADMTAVFQDPWMQVLIQFIFFVACGAGVGAVMALRRRGPEMFGLRGSPTRWLLVGSAAGLIGGIVYHLMMALHARIAGNVPASQALAQETMGGFGFVQVPLFVIISLLGFIVAEALFRGLFYAWLRRWGVVLAVAISSLVYGLVLGGTALNLATTGSYAVLGVVSAILYERSGSLWPAIAASATAGYLILVLAVLRPLA